MSRQNVFARNAYGAIGTVLGAYEYSQHGWLAVGIGAALWVLLGLTWVDR